MADLSIDESTLKPAFQIPPSQTARTDVGITNGARPARAGWGGWRFPKFEGGKEGRGDGGQVIKPLNHTIQFMGGINLKGKLPNFALAETRGMTMNWTPANTKRRKQDAITRTQ